MKLERLSPEQDRGDQVGQDPTSRPWLLLCLGLFCLAAAPVTAAKNDLDQPPQKHGWQEASPGPVLETGAPVILPALKKSPFSIGGDLEGDDEEDEEDSVAALTLTC